MSKLKRTLSSFLVSVVLGVVTLPAMASGGGGGAITPPRPGASDAFAMTKTVRGTLVKLDVEKNTITVKDAKDKEFTLNLGKKTKYHAEDAKDFGGRKDLKPEDISANSNLKVTFQEIDKTVVEIKVLKKS